MAEAQSMLDAILPGQNFASVNHVIDHISQIKQNDYKNAYDEGESL